MIGKRKGISIFLPIFIVAAVIIVIAVAAYFAIQLPGSLPTNTSTPTTFTVTSGSYSYQTYEDKNLTYAVVYIVEGASLGKEVPFSPQNATVVIGLNNTVVWRNLDTVNQTITESGGLFNETLAPLQNWNFTFANPGTYSYTNPYYSWENGSVTVVS